MVVIPAQSEIGFLRCTCHGDRIPEDLKKLQSLQKQHSQHPDDITPIVLAFHWGRVYYLLPT